MTDLTAAIEQAQNEVRLAKTFATGALEDERKMHAIAARCKRNLHRCETRLNRLQLAQEAQENAARGLCPCGRQIPQKAPGTRGGKRRYCSKECSNYYWVLFNRAIEEE